MRDQLPDILAETLGQIVGEVSRDFERDCEVRLSAIQVEITALRADKAEFKLELDRFVRDMERRVCERLAELKDGDSVTLDDVRPVIVDEITRHFDAIPKPLDDAAIESSAGAAVERRMDEIARRAAEVVQQGLPDVFAIVAEQLASATEAIAARAASQETLTREDVIAIASELIPPVAEEVPERPDFQAMVDNAVAAAFVTVPVPRNGRDADPETTAELVREEVSKTAVAIEAAFRPVDATTVATMVADEVKRAFDAQPAPEPGHTPTEDELLPLVDRVVERAMKAVRIPEDGHTPTTEEIRQIVAGEVAAAIAELPEPKPGEPGPPGKLPIARAWSEGVHYEGEVRTHAGATWQALRDTAQEPPHDDWICLASAGSDPRDWSVHGLYDPAGSYRKFDVVVFNGSEWRAKRDDPGPLPGDGWAISAQIGRPGKPGGPGLKGDPGPPGPKIAAWEIKDYSAIPVLTDGTLGPPLDLTGILEDYHSEAVR